MTEARKIILEFGGRYTDRHRLPVSVLTQTVSNLQKAVYLLALEQENIEVKKNERLSGELSQRYVLLVEPPQAGSFAAVLSIGDSGQQSMLEDIEFKIQNVTNNLTCALQNVSENSIEKLRELVRDQSRYGRLIGSIKAALPRKSSGNNLTIMHARTMPNLPKGLLD